MRLASTLAAAAALITAGAAYADNRIQELDYDAASVVRVDACLGFQTMIEFGADERIENVGVGDATQWLVVPNARANLLFVRPTLATTHSNMTVATSRRRYVFELQAAQTQACARGDVLYYLRFRHADAAAPVQAAADQPAAAVDAPMPAAERNTAYTFSGARANVPHRVFDDGRATYFKWDDATATPAVFAVSADGAESLASFTSQGEYLVVDQVAPRFVLRSGESVTTLVNEAFVEPVLDAQSPQPRERARSCFLFFCSKARDDAD